MRSATTNMPLNKFGRTALMYCALIEDDAWSFSLAQNLIEKGANIGLRDSNGFSALMYACFYERLNLLNLFLSSPGDYNLLSKDKYGNTCFHLAGLSKTDEICTTIYKIACKFNLDPAEINKNYFGHFPIDLCRLNKHEQCIKTYHMPKVSQVDKEITRLSTPSEKKSSNPLFFNVNNLNLIPLIRITEGDPSDEIESSNKNSECEMSNKSSTDSSLIQDTLASSLASESRKTTTRTLVFYNQLNLYKFLQSQKEPLIKENEFVNKINSEPKLKSDYVDFSKKNVPKCVITRNLLSDQFELIKRERTRALSEKRRPVSSKNSGEFDFNKPWRHNMKNLYETFEFQNTGSFRKPNTNLTTNLFEQLTTGLF